MNTKEFLNKLIGGINIYTIKTYKDMEELIKSGETVKEELTGALQDIRDYLGGQGKPKGYSKGTSYQDYDTIHGSRSELHADQYQRILEEARHLESMLVLQGSSLERYYKMKNEIDNCLNNNMGITEKVSILREKFTQEEVAELIEVSISTIKRVDRKNKENIMLSINK